MTGTTYKVKKLIQGYSLGQAFFGKIFVAVPKKILEENNIVRVQFGDKFMIIDDKMKPVTSQEFPDKFGREQWYTLCYFEWKETK